MTQALILKITLKDVRPATWRELAVPVGTTYAQLHMMLQIAFGWENAHLYAFYPNWDHSISYEDHSGGEWDFDDGSNTSTDDAQAQIKYDLQKDTVRYIYDFGETWTHLIKLERSKDVTGALPRCLDGKGKGFLEDGNGASSKPLSLSAINKQLAAWSADEDFEPEGTIEDFSAMLKQVLPMMPKDTQGAMAAFKKAPEFNALKELPGPIVDSVMVGLMSTTMKPLAEWKKTDLKKAVQSVQQDQEEDDKQLINGIAALFFHAMARLGRLKVDPDAVLTELGLGDEQGSDDDFDQELDDEISSTFDKDDNPIDGDWDAEDAQRLADNDALEQLFNDFRDSSQWGHLTKILKGEDVIDYFLAFTAAMTENGGVVPKNWEPEAVVDALANWVPDDVVATPEDEAAFTMVMRAFAAHVTADKVLPAKAAQEFQQAVTQGLQARAQVGLSAANLKELQVRLPKGRPHVMKVGSKKWYQKTATSVHKEAWRRLDAVWAAGHFHGEQLDTCAMVADFANDIYAATLQTPLHWQDAAAKQILSKSMTSKTQEQRQDFEALMAAFLDAMTAETSMTKKRARALQDLVHQTLANLPKQSLGRKVSKKAGRKILKFQKRS